MSRKFENVDQACAAIIRGVIKRLAFQGEVAVIVEDALKIAFETDQTLKQELGVVFGVRP